MDQINMFQGEPLKIDKGIRLIELFAGIGSQAKALERLGVDFEPWKAVEIDKYAVKSYNAVHKNYLKEDITTSDITQIHAQDLDITDTDKYVYIMTYSFPCQDISNAGLQKGYEKGSGTRSGLLWEVERILNECEQKPQILLMENVPQVHGKKNKDNWELWLKTLSDLGYVNHWTDMNAKDYGTPQNRKRCFCVSILKDSGLGTDYTFPEPFELTRCLEDVLQPEDEIEPKYYLGEEAVRGLLEQMRNFPIPLP